jgi:hypothetical protein
MPGFGDIGEFDSYSDEADERRVVGVELVNYDQWLNAYMMAPKVAMAPMKQAMERATLLVEGYLRTSGYPPEVEGNMPGRTRTVTDDKGKTREVAMGYYERGRGAWYPVMMPDTLLGVDKKQKLGKTRGRVKAPTKLRKAGIVFGYKLALNGGIAGTSEKLGQSWTTEVNEDNGTIEGVLGNNTTYALYVQGYLQAMQHEESGWITVAQALELSREGINAAFAEAAQEVIATVVKMGSG